MVLPPPEPIYTLRGEMAGVTSMVTSLLHERELLYAGTLAGKVHVWDLINFREVKRHVIGRTSCLSVVDNSQFFITQDRQGYIKLWIQTPDLNWTLHRLITTGYPGFCKLSATPNFIIYPVLDSKFKVYFMRNLKEIVFTPPQTKLGETLILKYLTQSNQVIAGFEIGTLVLWKISTEEICHSLQISTFPLCAIDFSETHNFGIIGTTDKFIYKFEINSNKIVVLKEIKIPSPGINSVLIDASGKLFSVTCWDGRLRYYSASGCRPLCFVDYHDQSLNAAVYSKLELEICKSKVLLAGSKDGRISLWNVYC